LTSIDSGRVEVAEELRREVAGEVVRADGEGHERLAAGRHPRLRQRRIGGGQPADHLEVLGRHRVTVGVDDEVDVRPVVVEQEHRDEIGEGGDEDVGEPPEDRVGVLRQVEHEARLEHRLEQRSHLTSTVVRTRHRRA
jgi:hypothetical protein